MPCQSCETRYGNDGRGCGSPSHKPELDKVTAMLCAVMHQLELRNKHGNPFMLPLLLNKVDGLEDWWEEHQRKDRVREAKEQQEAQEKAEAKAAWDKLTPRQRKLLGARAP